MPRETITLRAEDGTDTTASAEVFRYGSGARTLKSIAFIGGGVLGGAACIIIPVLHLITTWALPLVGILAGVRAYRTHAQVLQVAGPCPKCGESVALPGGSMGEHSLTQPCPECEAVLEMVIAPAA